MSRPTAYLSRLGIALTIGLCLTTSLEAQSQNSQEESIFETQPSRAPDALFGSAQSLRGDVFGRAPTPMRRQRRMSVVWKYEMQPIPEEELELHKTVKQLQKQLNEAGSDESKEKIQDELLAALQSQFDADYDRREKEIASLEERISKLRAKLDKRKNARDEIVNVRFKSIVHASEGMSFPDPYGGSNRGLLPVAPIPPGQSPARFGPPVVAPDPDPFGGYAPRPAPAVAPADPVLPAESPFSRANTPAPTR